jgi:hypothetical protein
MSGEHTKKLHAMCGIKKLLLTRAVADYMDKAAPDVREFFRTVNGSAAEVIQDLKRQLAERQEDSADKDRLIVANARLKTKNGNYRLGMKQLQKAHEALLHRYNTLKASTEVRRDAEQQQNTLRIEEPGYTDYFRDRIVDGNRLFDNRAQSAGVINTRL